MEQIIERMHLSGRYVLELFGPDGRLKWRDTIDNLVTTEGKNSALDVHLGGAAQIATWYMGLIPTTGYAAIVAADVAAQINGTNGWKEAGNANAPAYTGNRKTLAWSAAVAAVKSTSAAAAFVFTSAGTLKGAFIASTNAVDGTTGKLFSAGLNTGGDKPVGIGDTLNVSYAASA